MLTAMATLSKPLRLAIHVMNLWRNRRLNYAFVQAKAALGERMYAAGIDDGELGARISAVEEQLRRPEAAGDSTQELLAARRQLILQLAAAALEDDAPLPGADAEYDKAREAEAALRRHQSDMERKPGSSGRLVNG